MKKKLKGERSKSLYTEWLPAEKPGHNHCEQCDLLWPSFFRCDIHWHQTAKY